MKDVKILKYNGYATSEEGVIYRAVAIKGKWRLVDYSDPWNQPFVNDIEYDTPLEALSIIDTL